VLQLPGPAQNDLLIHFCGRGTHRNVESVDDRILRMAPEDRLAGILAEGRIRAFTQHNGGFPAVCFCEVDKEFAHLRWLIDQRNFAPWGLIFTREQVTKWGGGPVFSARKDIHGYVDYLARMEMEQTGSAVNADYLRSYMTRFEPFDPRNPSDWLWEQEWRHIVPGGERALAAGSIKAIMVGDPHWWPADPETGEPPQLWVESEKWFWDGDTLQVIKRIGEV
jgi:hypothetical protein